MKWLFFLGALFLLVFELANAYFIMPMPGSQEMESITLAYFLYSWRWSLRILFGLLMLAGVRAAWKGSKWITAFLFLLAGGVTYMVNAKMMAEQMFRQPSQLILKSGKENTVDPDRLVIGIEYNGQAKAYPIQFIGHHHQVRDSIGGKPVIVTYCTVCRTGRVYEPIVKGAPEEFRLVGMDHFNAMFEDHRTKSWWRQVTGEAIAGPLKGEMLPEFPSTQTSLQSWLKLFPHTLIMQPDPAFESIYEGMSDFETGRTTGNLTIYDSTSWNRKSWIAGIVVGVNSKAYDWNQLKKKKIIHDQIGDTPILLFVTDQDRSLFGMVRNSAEQVFQIQNDTLWNGIIPYDLLGRSLQAGVKDLDRVNVYQEYWHSWQTFHPLTERYLQE